MEKICICCRKKLGLITGSNKIDENDSKLVCDKCYRIFSTILNIVKKCEVLII